MPDDEAIDCPQFEEEGWLLLSGELAPPERLVWEKHLAGCPECAGRLAERRQVLDLYDGLAPGRDGAVQVRPPVVAAPAPIAGTHRTALTVAASLVLLILGALAGRAVRPTVAPGGMLHSFEQRLADVEAQLAAAQLVPASAAERLKAAATSSAVVDRDPRVVGALLHALASDPSPNVRMAVVGVLYEARATGSLEDRFAEVLEAQASPLLRIALIELAADRRLTRTVPVLRRVAAESADPAVRERAQWAVGLLSRGA